MLAILKIGQLGSFGHLSPFLGTNTGTDPMDTLQLEMTFIVRSWNKPKRAHRPPGSRPQSLTTTPLTAPPRLGGYWRLSAPSRRHKLPVTASR